MRSERQRGRRALGAALTAGLWLLWAAPLRAEKPAKKRGISSKKPTIVRFPTLEIHEDGRSVVSLRLSDAAAQVQLEAATLGYRLRIVNARAVVRNDRHKLDAEHFGAAVRSVQLWQRGADVLCWIQLREQVAPSAPWVRAPSAAERAEEPRKDAGETAIVWTLEFPRVASKPAD